MEQKETITQQLSGMGVSEQIEFLQKKNITLKSWGELEKVYDSEKHPVITDSSYRDVVEQGHTDKVTRITSDLPRLSVKRMTELITGIPIKRVYHAESDGEKEAAKYLENLMQRNRIDSVNIDRLNQLYASCEVITLWYLTQTEQSHKSYGFETNYKLRCRTFSPMHGDKLYPRFNEEGDCIAISVAYSYKEGEKETHYMDTYTQDKHILYQREEGDWEIAVEENIIIGKIPAVYMYRPTPIWENADRINTEIEWLLSRTGNYIRKNSKPMLLVTEDEAVPTGRALPETEEFKEVIQLSKGAGMQYVTWGLQVDTTKFYYERLKELFWTELQLPDWSYDNMKNNAMSGESRKQLFIDAQLKVKDESGRVLEFCDREVNVVKAFLKVMQPQLSDAIDSVQVETIITPFTITDERDMLENISIAKSNGLISSREAIERLGWSNDTERTMEELQAEQQQAMQNALPQYE